jgi:hypothetical protein
MPRISEDDILLLSLHNDFGAILIIAIQFLNCKRELLELLWGLEMDM